MKARAIAIPLLVLLGASDGSGPAARVCEAPLGWRIAEIDPSFGLDVPEAAAAVEEAADLWEAAAGRALFHRDPEEGFPVRFVHDERHAGIRERLAREGELARESDELLEARDAVRELGARLEAGREEHERRLDAYEERRSSHQAEVRSWNERGGAPPDEAARLRERAEALERERRELDSAAEALVALRGRVNAETDRVNREAEAHARRIDALREEFPAEAVQSGRYSESRRTLGPWSFSVEREIEIFQFDDATHLRLVLAHELGHALGLAHVGERDALMFVYADARRLRRGELRLHERDVEELTRVCG